MADVVGTAFVRIKALTNNLGKDIEKSVKKGIKDANLEKVGKDAGSDTGESFGEGFSDSATKSIKRRSRRSGGIIPDDLFDDARKNIDRLGEKFKDIDFNFNPDIEFENTFDRISERQKKLINDSISDFGRLDNEVKRRTGSIGKSFDKLFDRIRQSSQVSLGGGFLKTLAGVGGVIVGGLTLALPAIQDIGSAILAYATGLVAQIGFLTVALSGLSVAAVGALGSAATAILPIVLAFGSETETLIEFKDAMTAAGEEFLRIGTATQQSLLPALDNSVFRLTELVPLFAEYGLYVGDIVGRFADYASAVLTGEEAQGRFTDILNSSLNILEDLAAIILNVGDLLSGLWVAAIPASERFASSLRDLTGRWSDLITEGLRTGDLTETLNEWYDRAELVGSALGNLSGALFDVLQVGADSADSLFVRFDDWAEGYREFTESEAGQNRLALIFDNSLAVMEQINGVIADLFDGIFGRLGELGGVDGIVEALEGFREILPGLQESFQDFLDTVDDVNAFIGPRIWDNIVKAFERLREPLGRLVFSFADFLEAIEESNSFETFLDLMAILTDTLSVLLSIPGFGTFVGYLIAFGTAAKVSAIALGPFIRLLGPFVTGLKALAASSLVTSLGSLGGAIRGIVTASRGAQVSGASISAINAGLSSIGSAGTVGTLGRVGAGLSALGPFGIAAGIAVAGAGVAFFKARKDAQEFEQEVRQVTDALGKLNGGLNITAEGIAEYVRESSRFESRNQLDDLARIGIGVEELAEGVETGTLSFSEFGDAALRAGEVTITAIGDLTNRRNNRDLAATVGSVDELREAFNLTAEEADQLFEEGFLNTDDLRLVVSGNDDLAESFSELYKVIGEGAKDSFGEFASNAQNIRLLGRDVLNDIAVDLADAEPEEAVEIMTGALSDLREEAIRDTRQIEGLSEATRDQARAQATLADGTVDYVRENQILRNEQKKLFDQIRANYDLFFSVEFQRLPITGAIEEFSSKFDDIDIDIFKELAEGGGADALKFVFGDIGRAAQDLFTQLGNLPEEEFNAAAQALNLDAESLRTAMNGAEEAIQSLGDTAVSTLPSVAELLDDATSTSEEDGSQFFDEQGFIDGIKERTTNAQEFGTNIATIRDRLGEEAARQAVQDGPEAAKKLSEIATGPNGAALTTALANMEEAEKGLREQIRTELGPGIALEYIATAQPIAEGFGFGLAAGFNAPATKVALRNAGIDTLNFMQQGFQGRFVFTGGQLEFIPTGRFPSTGGGTRRPTAGIDRFGFSSGGFVPGTGVFGGGPSGTDTVPAWLTPGEFVLRRSVAQAIPSNILTSLNAGSPRLVNLLSSLNQTRSAPPVVSPAAVAQGGVRAGAGAPTFAPGSVVIYAQGTSAHEVLSEFDHRVNWKLTSRGDQ